MVVQQYQWEFGYTFMRQVLIKLTKHISQPLFSCFTSLPELRYIARLMDPCLTLGIPMPSGAEESISFLFMAIGYCNVGGKNFLWVELQGKYAAWNMLK